MREPCVTHCPRLRAAAFLGTFTLRMSHQRMNLPAELVRLLQQVPELSRAYLVCGCVRDALLGITHKDFDLEVYGVGYEALERALGARGRVDLVGKSFGVIKFSSRSGAQWDFSLPRRDSKMSAGHQGFEVEFD